MSKSQPAVAAELSWEQVLRWRIDRHLLAAERERGTDLVGIVRRLAGVHAIAATGLRQLDAVMSGGDRSQVSRPQGWISPTLLVDGRIAGTWEAAGGTTDELTVAVVPFGPLSRSVRTGVARAAERLAAATDAARLRLDLRSRTGV